MMKASELKIKRLTIALLFLILQLNVKAQSDCCNDATCSGAAKQLALEMKNAVSVLGAYPNDEEKADNTIAAIKVNDPAAYKKITGAVHNVKNWLDTSSSKKLCFASQFTDMNTLSWAEHLNKTFYPSQFRSPEFVRGWGLNLDINQGVADLLKETETYSASGRALLSYTFSKYPTAGHVRVLLGPSFYYQQKTTWLLVNARAEFRLKDIGNELLSIGTTKLIVEANANDKKFIGGIGFGLELASFGVQVLGEYESNSSQNYLLQTGLVYRANFLMKSK